MISKSFDLVDKIDIDALMANDVREGRTMDYREECQETRIATNWNFWPTYLPLLMQR